MGWLSSDCHPDTRNVRSSLERTIPTLRWNCPLQRSGENNANANLHLARDAIKSVCDALHGRASSTPRGRARGRPVVLESVKDALSGNVVDTLENVADASKSNMITFCKEVSKAHDRQQHTHSIAKHHGVWKHYVRSARRTDAHGTREKTVNNR